MGIHFDFSEVRAVASRLNSAQGRIGAAASAAFRKTVHDIEADAKGFSAVDTGAQRESISSTITGDGRHGEMSAEIGPTTEYSPYQEFGTSTQPGTPFMGPAYDRRIDPFTEALAQLAAREVL